MSSAVTRKPNTIYLERFVFMAALLIPSAYLQGARVIFVCALSIVFCMLTDKVCCFIRRIPYDIRDYAVPFWGLAAAMLMPSGISVWLIALCAVICIALGKHIFGGSENIVFSPPAIAAAFLIVCRPADMLYYTRSGEHYPIFGEFSGTLTRSLEYSVKLGNIPSDSILDILLGDTAGAIGAVNILVIAVCGVCLLVRRSASTCVVVPCLAVSAVLAFFFPRVDVSGAESVFYELSSGCLLFGTVFIAAEPYLVPKKASARVMYGIVLGYTTMMFRYFGETEYCFVFALLITGALTDGFDRIVENLSYWKRNYISSFEKSKTQVQRGGGMKLTDTQEIILPERYRYNTPPIDAQIKRKHRNPTETTEATESTEKEGGDENE